MGHPILAVAGVAFMVGFIVLGPLAGLNLGVSAAIGIIFGGGLVAISFEV